MSKEISFHGRPPSKGKTRAEDAFASLGIKAPSEKTKRLTVDIPASLHSRVKLKCVQQETSIAEVVREILEQRFPSE